MNTQTKILAGFIIGLMAIAFVGYEVHDQLTELSSSFHKKNKHQANFTALSRLMSTLSKTESYVRSFTIKENQNDIDSYKQSKEEIAFTLKNLNRTMGAYPVYQELSNNIDQKIQVLDRMIEIKENNDSDAFIDKAMAEITKYNDNIEAIRSEEFSDTTKNPKASQQEEVLKHAHPLKNPRKKPGFFKRLFGKKEKKENNNESQRPSTDTSENVDTVAQKSLLVDKNIQEKSAENSAKKKIDKTKASINSSIERLKKLKQEESSRYEMIMTSLIKQDLKVSEKIRENIQDLEHLEADNNKNFTIATTRFRDGIVDNTRIVGLGSLSIILILSLVVMNDFNKIRKNRNSLIAEKEKAKKLAQVKEQFLANMSHEIRTPMNAIVGFSELLEKTTLTEDQKKYLLTIQHSSNHLMVVLNDILDFSKLESGKLNIKKQPFKPGECIRHVVDSMSTEANKNKLDLHLNLDENMQTTLIGDPYRLQQILYNLLSNAIKYTEKGSINIEAKGIADKENSQLLKLIVKDEGVGISKDNIEKIFNDFEQIDSGTLKKNGGTGLGLSIVKKLVKIHNGSIDVHSEENKGSTFTITIPYPISDQAEIIDDKLEEGDQNTVENIRVLAVDDQEYNLELLEIILKKWKVDVDIVNSGKKALESIANKNYDLVLMDIQMPDMDGLEATRKIREKGYGDLPIIALTAASTKEETDRCLAAGMNGFLLKPFKQNDLREVINKYTSKHSDSESAHDKEYNLSNLTSLSNGDSSFITHMLQVYIENMDSDIEKLEEYILSCNWQAAGLQAHKMIAPNRHLGIDRLADILEKIEHRGLNKQKLQTLPGLLDKIKKEAALAIKNINREISVRSTDSQDNIRNAS